MKVTSRLVRRARVRDAVALEAEGDSGDESCEAAVAGPLSDMRNSSLLI